MQQPFRWTSPRATALLILRAWLGEPANVSTDALGLTQFQHAAVERLRTALTRRRGAILADSVGLGKTFVALALLRAALDANERILVIAPAALRTHWRKHLAKLGTHDIAFTTHTALSRGRVPAVDAAFIVIDEAHALRNPNTRRYRTLQRIVKGARVLLLSATPVNNSADDLYHLIRIFARDDAFRDLGVADLNRAFRRQSQSEVDRVLNEVLVRRSRAHVRTERNLAFPERAAPVAVRYDAEWPDSLYDALEKLTFAPYALESVAPAELMRLHLLKRLESSVMAFRSSLRSLRSITDAFVTGAPANVLPTRSRDDDWVQLHLPITLESDATQRRERLQHEAVRDTELLRSCNHAIRNAADAKLAKLTELLERDCRGDKVLIFSQYADTAVHLWKQLRTRWRVGLITGNDARLGANRAARNTVIDCFAPRANGVRSKLHERMQLTVLIATDVLSEGLNLQDASVVVNYEISWNPVTLMQRVGRIDRLGSPHARVRVYNFIPERGLDRLLRLMERVEHKLATIARLVGTDAPVLDVPAVGAARSAVEQSLDIEQKAEPAQLEALSAVEALRTELTTDTVHIRCNAPAASAFPGERNLSLIAVHWGGSLRLLLCDADGVRENVAEAAALLRGALSHDTESEPRSCDVEPAIRWLRAEQSSAAFRSLRTTSAQRDAALKLLALARDLPAQSPLASRAERLLRALAQPLPLEMLPGLALWAESPGDGANAYVALEEMLSHLPRSKAERVNSPRVLAVLHVIGGA